MVSKLGRCVMIHSNSLLGCCLAISWVVPSPVSKKWGRKGPEKNAYLDNPTHRLGWLTLGCRPGLGLKRFKVMALGLKGWGGA